MVVHEKIITFQVMWKLFLVMWVTKSHITWLLKNNPFTQNDKNLTTKKCFYYYYYPTNNRLVNNGKQYNFCLSFRQPRHLNNK